MGGNENFEPVFNFCVKTLEEKWLRNDYREFLELILLLLGYQNDSRPIVIKQPGAYHQVRWTAKAVYSLKIYLFREQFRFTSTETIALLQINAFIVKCYCQYWFVANRAEKAPLADLKFLRRLYNYPVKKMSDIAVKKFLNHLYYLKDQCILLSFYDDDVSNEIKGNICEAILNEEDKHIKNDNIDYDEENSDQREEDDTSESMPKKLILQMRQVPEFLQRGDNDTL